MPVRALLSLRLARLCGALLLLAVVAGPPASLAAQEDIETESITEQGTLDPFSADDRDLRSIFDEAERLFRSMDQADSVPLFDRLIARLESNRARGALTDDLRAMLIQCRSHRAETHFNLGEDDRADEDLRSILELDPGWLIDPDMVSPKLVERVEELRREMVGELLVLVEPIDATATFGGRSIEFIGQPTPVLAGSQTLSLTRAGFAPVEEVVEVRAGRSTTADHTLERLSAVVHIRVRPAGASLLVDGEPAQVAQRETLPGEDPEEDISIEGLIPGRHVLEIRLPEHRPHRVGFEAVDLEDYGLPPAALELMQGEVHFVDLPADAEVTIGGRKASPAPGADGTATVGLPPGDYVIEVHKPGIGGFREEVAVGDQEIVRLVVELEPTIAFLGVLGSDRLAASDLSKRLAARFERLADWLWTDHSIRAPAVLDAAGLNATEMRRLGALASRRAGPDWAEIRGSFDDEFPASVYLVAVLGDDLFATSAELWLWSPAPWPAAPVTRTLPLQGGEEELERLVSAFTADVVPSRVQLGARFIETDGVLVSTVMPDGPAAAAGLAVGDRVASISGQPVSTVRELLERTASLAGSEAVVSVGAQGNARELTLAVERRPGVLALSDSRVLEPVLAARLSLELLRGTHGLPRWLLQLNQAALYLRAMEYEAAVPLLRTIEAPQGGGLSQAMADYWLGTTLLSIDPRVYGDAARASLERALGQEGARLYHADGPLLAPRARARLAELGRLLGN